MTRLVALLVLITLLAPSTAMARNPPPVRPADDAFDAILSGSKGGPAVKEEASGNAARGASATSSTASNVRYEWRTPCSGGIGNAVTGAPVCPQNNCPPGQGQYRLFRIAPGAETPLGLVCSGDGAPENVPAAAPPQVTEAMILRAFRRIPLPALRSQSQPDDKTLINFDTIFFTQAEPLTRQLTLLGQRVRLEITPSRFEWVHGDGTTATTTTPGAPYPAKDIVHRYADAHRTVAHRVVVTWSAEYALNGGALQPVNGTVTTTGPATPLRVAEASPALSGSGH
jgi:hypothetical protein